jgi:two-component system, OmpR family, phosphate regulon sensor histidine kinase PhoR
MPDIDGLQVLKEIRKVNPNTVCFISTAYASYENAVDSIKFGAFSYIPKPFTSEELLERLNEGLQKRNLLLEAENWKKEREEKLLEVAFEKTRLNTIINSMAEGVLVVNKNRQVVLFNPCTLKFLKLIKLKLSRILMNSSTSISRTN